MFDVDSYGPACAHDAVWPLSLNQPRKFFMVNQKSFACCGADASEYSSARDESTALMQVSTVETSS